MWQGAGVDAASLLDRATPGSLVGLVVAPDGAAALATGDGVAVIEPPNAFETVARADRETGPRWVIWSQSTASALVAEGVRLARAWDLVAVHRLLFGGWESDPGSLWARAQDLPTDRLPVDRAPNLFDQPDPAEDASALAVTEAGYLRAEWVGGGWAEPPERVAEWARLALDLAQRQLTLIDSLPNPTRALATARAESAAELLCAELAADGLPLDRSIATSIIEAAAGPRPRDEAHASAIRAARDGAVLRHAPPGTSFDLRSPGQVKSLLRRVGIEVADTRAWRLEALREDSPLVDALLVWRKAERMATTYGYGWLDEHVGSDGRLRGAWSGADGAAGRMTATAGLHNLPAELRPAVVAVPGHVFVRADLGQIEPRVLAAVSGDPALIASTAADDMYVPVARDLGVDRATAKVAMLGAMYGQTTGRGAQALRGVQRSDPVAMEYLESSDRAAQVGTDLRTFGGRLVRMGVANANATSERVLRSHAAARGRFGRNAMVQGAAAELFKQWAVTVRARGELLDARVVLCLHDELLVHVPDANAEAAAAMVTECLQEVAHRWAPHQAAGGPSVRFTAEISTIGCWADAKG